MSGVTLGPIVFRDFELPESITFGGQQRLQVHRLSGGGTIIDQLGSEDRDITWSGIMIGPEAADRARRLDVMRQVGTPNMLSFGSFACDVILRDFEADYRRASWIGRYRIKCAIVQPLTVWEGDLAAIVADLQIAGSIDPSGVIPGFAVALQAAQSAAASLISYKTGGASNVDVDTAIANVVSITGSVQSTAESSLLSQVNYDPSPLQVAAVDPTAESLAKSTVASGLVGRAGLNLQDAV